MPRPFGGFLSLLVVGRGLLLGCGTLLGNRRDRLAGFRVGLALRASHELLLSVAPLATRPEHVAPGRCALRGLFLTISLFELRHVGVGSGSLTGGPLRVVLPLAR